MRKKSEVKMKMKKVVAICLVLCMVFALAACGGSGEGGEGESAGGVITVISREDGSGTRGAFVELMGILDENEVDQTTTSAEISQSTSVVMTTVAGNTNAIGYVSLGSLDDSVKAIKVDGVAPTVENIKGGSYAVSRPFEVVTKDGLSDAAKDFIKFIMSADGQKILEEEGYISIDDGAAAYEQQSGISGRIVCAGSTSVGPVMQVLADAYKAIYSDVEIEIQQTGSGAGITAAGEGTCDIGMSSRALKDEELAAGLTETTIAMDGIAVIVNKENTVEDLTSEQIKNIFIGEVTDWGDVK